MKFGGRGDPAVSGFLAEPRQNTAANLPAEPHQCFKPTVSSRVGTRLGLRAKPYWAAPWCFVGLITTARRFVLFRLKGDGNKGGTARIASNYRVILQSSVEEVTAA